MESGDEVLRDKGDAGLRILGMVVGGGAGSFFTVIAGNYGGVDPLWIAGLPGVLLAAESGCSRCAARGGGASSARSPSSSPSSQRSSPTE